MVNFETITSNLQMGKIVHNNIEGITLLGKAHHSPVQIQLQSSFSITEL